MHSFRAILFLLALAPQLAWAQAPTLSHVLPGAVQPGKSTDITCFGGNLAGAKAIWLSFPGQAELPADIEKNGTDAAKVTFRITLPPEAVPQVAGVRVTTDKGVSNLRLLLVDDLPSVADNGKNKTPEKAQEITLPVAIDGTCEAESYDYFRFAAKKGQRVSLEVYARRLGFALDPVVRLLDAAGRELAYSDDEPGLGPDSRLACEIPADGNYIIEIRDIAYTGGAGHRYRLRVGDFPLVDVPFPLAAQKGSSVKVEAVGPGVADAPPKDVAVAADAAGAVPVAVSRTGGTGSALVRLLVDELPETIEAEPNNDREQATAFTAPCGINGRFAEAGDRDFYRIEAKKGQRLVFRGQTRGLGSPTDLLMKLLKADGGSVAEAEDAGSEEGAINFTFPEDGTYYLSAEDLVRRGGPQHAYRVEVRPNQPGFSLAVEADKYDAPRGGVFVAKVTAARRDYNGPIELRVEGAGEGFAVAANTIPEGKNETTLSVTLPARLEPGTICRLNVVGKGKIGEQEFEAHADTTAALVKQLSGWPYLASDLTSAVAVGVGPEFPEFFKLSLEPAEIALVLAKDAKFKVKVEKLNKFDDAVNVEVIGLPEGVTAEVKPIEKGKAETEATLKAADAAKAGEYRFQVRGSATFQNQPKKVTLEEILLKVNAE